MTADELLATLSPLATTAKNASDRLPLADFQDALTDLWPDIAACLERLAAAEAERDEAVMLLNETRHLVSHDVWGIKRDLFLGRVHDEAVARRSQPWSR